MESAIKQFPPETLFFIILLLALAFAFHTKFTEKAAHNGPTILTTVGIFATFCGVASALLQFNTADIQGSVPSLLSGLKTAFVGSAAGIFFALTLKGREYIWGVNTLTTDSNPDRDATAADIVVQLRKIREALAGSEEGSLISQFKLSRQDTNDRLDALKAAQTEALAKLSELGSRALVEALRDVIRDFNQKLSEQFGENFKALNAAVGRLLAWQEQYKGVVETTVQKLGEAGALMTKAAADYASLVEKSGSLARAGEMLSSSAASLRAESQRLQEVSSALANLLRSAEGSLPQVEEKVLALTNQLTSAIMENQKQVGSALTENATATRNILQSAHESLTTSHKEHSSKISELVEKTKEQVTILDRALSEELEKSLKSLGMQLAALSEKFVADYTPLTERLRRVVEMSR
ncbi:MAG: hypothetical protein L0Y57_09675 [Beijerinckiaceae bacterium]|nr:hypothetical protein [Beijerinckiaceae bacterium]